MNIYKITRRDSADWDEYRSAVVYAMDEESARNMHPNGGSDYSHELWKETWVNPSNVIVEYIGIANRNVSAGIIQSDFKAG